MARGISLKKKEIVKEGISEHQKGRKQKWKYKISRKKPNGIDKSLHVNNYLMLMDYILQSKDI